MGSDLLEFSINLLKMVIIFHLILILTPALVWVERRGSAFIQNRFGPNRVGPLGFTQLIADAVKFFFKEEFIPEKSRSFVFYAAPILALIPAGLALGALPLSVPFELEAFRLPFGLLADSSFGPYRFAFQGFEIGIGIVFVLGISSLGAYALLMAGWGSSNKYSLFGALRASAQVISYELALGLSLVGILLLFGTFEFADMVAQQQGPLKFMFMGKSIQSPVFEAALPFFGSTSFYLPNWGVFYQPLGALLFLVAVFAETNRLPFDLPEAESELVAGYHTEYGGIKMNMFYIGEYGHMLVGAAIFCIFYLGGYNSFDPSWLQQKLSAVVSTNMSAFLTSVIIFALFLGKILSILWIFIWVRWSIPRFRYDQLMDLGWKTMLPWALANTIVTAIVIYFARTSGV